MVDPLSALGVAANVIQVVDFGLRVLDKGKDLAQHGITKEQKHLRWLAKDTERVCLELQEQLKSPDAAPEESENRVLEVAQRTKAVAADLERLLSGLSLTDSVEDQQRPTKRRRIAPARVAKCVLKAVWKEQDVARLKDTMTELQQDMILRLVALQTISLSTLTRSVEAIAGSLEAERKERLAVYEKLLPEIEELLSTSTTRSSTGPDIAYFSALLHGYVKQVRTVDFCQRLLETLAFEDIYRRYDGISPAHEETFKWIFDPDKTSFHDWASCKSGIYWITGKPGSGKSTLMRYIVRHESLNRLLQQWAGNDELIVASHFFWTAGTSMQKSQEGLLRTLLFHIIRQSPEHAHELVPARFKAGSLVGIPWTYEELYSTISAFAQRTKGKVKLCLFIDGLDEFHGEHTDLVDLIACISDSSQIKVCVASRPWNVFSRAYHCTADGHLAVQDLTKADITKYITDKLNQNPLFRNLQKTEDKGCQSLIETINTKAEGVFLWVYLVVRSLIRGFNNGDDLITLKCRLEEYPTTLDGYFQRMFDRVETVYLKHSARILLVSLYLFDGMHIWGPRCLEVEMTDPDYALLLSVPPTPCEAARFFGCDDCNLDLTLSSATQAHWNEFPRGKLEKICAYLDICTFERCDNENQHLTVQRLLDARTADLLVTDNIGHIGFVHRTARDFIAASGTLEELHSRAGPDFDVGLSRTRLELAEQKAMADMSFVGHPPLERICYSITTMVSLAKMAVGYDACVRPKNIGTYLELLRQFHATLVLFVEKLSMQGYDMEQLELERGELGQSVEDLQDQIKEVEQRYLQN